jgi:hypothetical protein
MAGNKMVSLEVICEFAFGVPINIHQQSRRCINLPKNLQYLKNILLVNLLILLISEYAQVNLFMLEAQILNFRRGVRLVVKKDLVGVA